MMSNPALEVEVLVQGVEEWLARELPGWATRTRFHAREPTADRARRQGGRPARRVPNAPAARSGQKSSV